MSQESVEIVRAHYEALAAGDAKAALAAIHPEIEIVDHDLPDADEPYTGLVGMARWQTDWEGSWASWRWEPEQFIAAGTRVVAVLQLYAEGRGSGVAVERLDAVVWSLQDGRCIRLDYYGSKTAALQAVGLAE